MPSEYLPFMNGPVDSYIWKEEKSQPTKYIDTKDKTQENHISERHYTCWETRKTKLKEKDTAENTETNTGYLIRRRNYKQTRIRSPTNQRIGEPSESQAIPCNRSNSLDLKNNF